MSSLDPPTMLGAKLPVPSELARYVFGPPVDLPRIATALGYKGWSTAYLGYECWLSTHSNELNTTVYIVY